MTTNSLTTLINLLNLILKTRIFIINLSFLIIKITFKIIITFRRRYNNSNNKDNKFRNKLIYVNRFKLLMKAETRYLLRRTRCHVS